MKRYDVVVLLDRPLSWAVRITFVRLAYSMASYTRLWPTLRSILTLLAHGRTGELPSWCRDNQLRATGPT